MMAIFFGEIGCYWHAFVFCIGRVLVEHISSSHRLHPTRIVTPLYTDGHCDLDDNIGTQLLVQFGLLEHSWTSQNRVIQPSCIEGSCEYFSIIVSRVDFRIVGTSDIVYQMK